VGTISASANCVKNLGCEGGLTMNEYMTLSKQQQEAEINKRPRWCHIEYENIKGWVSGKFLKEGSCNEQSQPIKQNNQTTVKNIQNYLRDDYLKNDLVIYLD
jgi:uncharacterized protein YgiM (DUF1202 family)